MADKSTQFFQYMKDHFIGFQQDQPLMTFEDNTTSRLGITTGDKIKAKGWVKIGEMTHSQGTIQTIDLPVPPHVLWVADLIMVFKYISFTHGERWVYPGGVFVDNVWDSLHPEGTIRLHLTYVPGGNGSMGIAVTVNPGHGDRPNRFITGVARQTAARADSLIEQFTGQTVIPA
jgi:hypothetical protein